MTRMIHSANHSSYPVGHDDPRDEATEAIVVAEQSRAFLDVVTDGQVRWPDLRAHCATCLDGELRRVAPMTVPGYLAASAVTPKPVKVSLPGAVALGGERHRAAAEALAEEVRELGAAGCRWFQVEERAEDATASIPVLEAAPAGSVTILWVGRPDSGRLAALPGTHLGLDATDAGVLELLPHLPPGRGVALVDMRMWRWMYAHPEATPAELKQAVRAIAREIWNKWYAPVFGRKDVELLAVYSHMVSNGLYLPDYPMGHVIASQLARAFREGDFGKDFERVCRQGRLTPEAWMKGAVGAPLSAQAMLAEARRALSAGTR